MSDDQMIKARRNPDGEIVQVLPDGSTRPFEETSDWARVDAMTDEEAYQNALDDPDNPPLTDERLATMRRIPNLPRLRLRLGLTQEEFARQFQIRLATLRDWEERNLHPDTTAIAYLRVIERIPDAVQQALANDLDQQPAAVGVNDRSDEGVRRSG